MSWKWTELTLTSVHPGSARSVTRALEPRGQRAGRWQSCQEPVTFTNTLWGHLHLVSPLSCRSYLCPVLSGWGTVGQAVLRGQSCLLLGQLSVCRCAQCQLEHLAPCPVVPAASVQWGGGHSRLRGLSEFSYFACVPPVTRCPLSGLFPNA